MILQFDKNKLQLVVLSGPNETVTPTPELSAIHDKLEALKQKLSVFQETEVLPVLKEIDTFVAEFNKLKSEG